MKFLIVEKGCPVAIFFVYIFLAMVTSSKLNVENSSKVRHVDETHSYLFLKFEIKSNQRILLKMMINHRKSRKTISEYIIERLYCTCMRIILC